MTVLYRRGFSLFQMVVVYQSHQHCSLTKPLSFLEFCQPLQGSPLKPSVSFSGSLKNSPVSSAL